MDDPGLIALIISLVTGISGVITIITTAYKNRYDKDKKYDTLCDEVEELKKFKMEAEKTMEAEAGKFDALEKLLKEHVKQSLKERICNIYDTCMKRGYIESWEYSDLSKTFCEYKNLNGNGLGERYFNELSKLPINRNANEEGGQQWAE